MSIVHLNSSQRRKLRTQLHHAADASYYRRLLAILELDRGKTVAEVAASEARPDPAALQHRDGVGRPSDWTEDLQALLLDALRQRHDESGYTGVNWTVALLQEHLYRRGGCRFSDDTIRRELDRLGYVWKRCRYVLPPDPEREKKTGNPAAAAGLAATHRQAG